MLKLFSFVGVSLCLISVSTFAQQKSQGTGVPHWMSKVTPENRQKMADLHQKMAECLRGDQSIGECHDQMVNGCKALGNDCPMGRGMMGKGPGMGMRRNQSQ